MEFYLSNWKFLAEAKPEMGTFSRNWLTGCPKARRYFNIPPFSLAQVDGSWYPLTWWKSRVFLVSNTHVLLIIGVCHLGGKFGVQFCVMAAAVALTVSQMGPCGTKLAWRGYGDTSLDTPFRCFEKYARLAHHKLQNFTQNSPPWSKTPFTSYSWLLYSIKI